MHESILMVYETLKILCFLATVFIYILTWRTRGHDDRETNAYLFAILGWGAAVGIF
jgi:hypothetical protein